jgi:hypothetical protein
MPTAISFRAVSLLPLEAAERLGEKYMRYYRTAVDLLPKTLKNALLDLT